MSLTAPPNAGEVRALAHQLMTWAEQLPPQRDFQHAVQPVKAVASAMRQFNALRSEAFDLPMGNPNWDVLLELFLRTADGQRVSLDVLVRDASLPLMSATRSVDVLAARGLIERLPDADDPYLEWLALTPVGQRKMEQALQGCAQAFGRTAAMPAFAPTHLCRAA